MDFGAGRPDPGRDLRTEGGPSEHPRRRGSPGPGGGWRSGTQESGRRAARPRSSSASGGSWGRGESVLARAGGPGRSRGRGNCPSPTYNLQFRFPAGGDRTVVHMDLYRLDDPEESGGAGWDELGAPDEIVLVEWPERAGEMAARRSLGGDAGPAPAGLSPPEGHGACGGTCRRPSPFPTGARDHSVHGPPPGPSIPPPPRGAWRWGGARISCGKAILPPTRDAIASTLLPHHPGFPERGGAHPRSWGGWVVGSGPGSLHRGEGGRCQRRWGLARGADLPLIPVSSLAAAAVDPLLEDPRPGVHRLRRPGGSALCRGPAHGGRQAGGGTRPLCQHGPELLARLEQLELPGLRLAGEGCGGTGPPSRGRVRGAGGSGGDGLSEGAFLWTGHGGGRPPPLSDSRGNGSRLPEGRAGPWCRRLDGAAISVGGVAELDPRAGRPPEGWHVRARRPAALPGVVAIEGRGLHHPPGPRRTFRSFFDRPPRGLLVLEEEGGRRGLRATPVLGCVMEQGELAQLAVRSRGTGKGAGGSAP